MKRIATQKNGFWKRVAINVPFVLMVALMIALFGGGLLLIFYSIASLFAFKSSMIFLILAGAGLIAIGAGLGLIVAYKKYFEFYNKKMGWEYPDAPKKEDKSVVDGKKTFKDYVTLPNVALVVLALGALFTIISAALGCINRDKWVDDTKTFMESNGYYSNVEHRTHKDTILETGTSDRINRIEINFIEKQAVIIYTTDTDKLGSVYYDYYVKFSNQLSFTRSKDGTVTITESAPPLIEETALKKLFFFIFKDFNVEKQVLIYLPEDTKEDMPNYIEIVGEKVIYAVTETPKRVKVRIETNKSDELRSKSCATIS